MTNPTLEYIRAALAARNLYPSFTFVSELQDGKLVHWVHLHVHNDRERLFDTVAPDENECLQKAYAALCEDK